MDSFSISYQIVTSGSTTPQMGITTVSAANAAAAEQSVKKSEATSSSESVTILSAQDMSQSGGNSTFSVTA